MVSHGRAAITFAMSSMELMLIHDAMRGDRRSASDRPEDDEHHVDHTRLSYDDHRSVDCPLAPLNCPVPCLGCPVPFTERARARARDGRRNATGKRGIAICTGV